MVRYESVSALQIEICPATGFDTGNMLYRTVYTCMQNDVHVFTCITKYVTNSYTNDKLSNICTDDCFKPYVLLVENIYVKLDCRRLALVLFLIKVRTLLISFFTIADLHCIYKVNFDVRVIIS